MPVVRITDSETFGRAIDVLLTQGGTFETWAVGELVVNRQQLAALVAANVIPSTQPTNARPNGKKPSSRNRSVE